MERADEGANGLNAAHVMLHLQIIYYILTEMYVVDSKHKDESEGKGNSTFNWSYCTVTMIHICINAVMFLRRRMLEPFYVCRCI